MSRKHRKSMADKPATRRYISRWCNRLYRDLSDCIVKATGSDGQRCRICGALLALHRLSVNDPTLCGTCEVNTQANVEAVTPERLRSVLGQWTYVTASSDDVKPRSDA